MSGPEFHPDMHLGQTEDICEHPYLIDKTKRSC